MKKPALIAIVFATSIITMMAMLSGCGKDPETPSAGVKAQFAYVTSQGDDKLSQFKVNEDGTLTALSPAFIQLPSSSFPSSMTFNSDRTRLYVSTNVGQKIYQYTIASDGTLSEIATAVSLSDQIDSISYGPNAVYAVSSTANALFQFTVAANGSLTANGSVTTGLAQPLHMAVLPEGTFAYAANTSTNTVAQFSVNSSSGALTALSPVTAATVGCPQSPTATARAANGQSYLYILSCSNDAVEVFSVANNGQVTSIQSATTGSEPNNMYVGNGFIYTADIVGSDVTMFKINIDGTLSSGTQLALTDAPETIAVDVIGKMAYILDFSNDVIRYARADANGALTLTGGTIAIGSGSNQILLK